MTLALPAQSNTIESYGSTGQWQLPVDLLKEYARRNTQGSTAKMSDDTADRSDRERVNARGDLLQQGARKINETRAKLLRSALKRRVESETALVRAPDNRVTGMQKWEGRVIEVDDDYFSAELVPFADGPVMVADFARDRLDEEEELQPGDVVYVTARTVRGIGGVTHTSTIRLRRLGRWTEEEIADQARRAKEQAAELAAYIE